MWYAAVCVLGFGLTSSTPVEADKALAGDWWLIGNGTPGAMVLKVKPDGKIEGTVYNHLLKGTYDPATKRLTFKRLLDADDATGRQEYTGVLSQMPNTKPAHYTLEGTFKSVAGKEWGQPDVAYQWSATAMRLPSPAEDLHDLQGRWTVAKVVGVQANAYKLPAGTHLDDKGVTLEIRGNQLLWDGKVTATLANDVPSSLFDSEVRQDVFRPLILTLPEGKAVPCTYCITEKGVQIVHPYPIGCRSPRQTITLQRTAP